jgi:hypothetical protein
MGTTSCQTWFTVSPGVLALPFVIWPSSAQ